LNDAKAKEYHWNSNPYFSIQVYYTLCYNALNVAKYNFEITYIE